MEVCSWESCLQMVGCSWENPWTKFTKWWIAMDFKGSLIFIHERFNEWWSIAKSMFTLVGLMDVGSFFGGNNGAFAWWLGWYEKLATKKMWESYGFLFGTWSRFTSPESLAIFSTPGVSIVHRRLVLVGRGLANLGDSCARKPIYPAIETEKKKLWALGFWWFWGMCENAKFWHLVSISLPKNNHWDLKILGMYLTYPNGRKTWKNNDFLGLCQPPTCLPNLCFLVSFFVVWHLDRWDSSMELNS